MRKRIVLNFVIFILVFVTSYMLHTLLFKEFARLSPVTLKSLYLFHSLFSLSLCVLFSLLQKTEKFKDQLGFLYLVSFGIKIAMFCVVFYEDIFTQGSFTNEESFNLLIPMFLSLILEVFIVSYLLKNPPEIKNAS